MIKSPGSPVKKNTSGMARAKSCNLEETDEEIIARDEMIRELQEAVEDRNQEMEMLKETIQALEEEIKNRTEDLSITVETWLKKEKKR